MNNRISWLRQQLDTDERNVERMEHDTDSSEAYSCPATRDYPLGDLPYGEANCTCNLAARKARALRQVQAHRAILDDYERAFENRKRHRDDMAIAGALLALHGAVKHVVSIYSDRDGYNPDWSA